MIVLCGLTLCNDSIKILLVSLAGDPQPQNSKLKIGFCVITSFSKSLP